MKITVNKTDVQVEGEAHEIREALPAVLGLEQSGASPAIVPVSGMLAPAGESAPLELEAPAVVDVEPAEPMIRTATDIAIDPDATAPDVANAPVPSGGYQPEEEWQQVPTSRRVWGANSTLHVATEPNGMDLYCGHVVGGLRRPRNWWPVPLRTAKVCGSCNRAIVREARP